MRQRDRPPLNALNGIGPQAGNKQECLLDM